MENFCVHLQQLTMRPGSFIYHLWEKPPLAVIMQVYLFNITNAEAFMSGADKKLKVDEVGPYVYQWVEVKIRLAKFYHNLTSINNEFDMISAKYWEYLSLFLLLHLRRTENCKCKLFLKLITQCPVLSSLFHQLVYFIPNVVNKLN